MFLALCWFFILWISVTSSVSVQAAEHDECHPWSFYNDTLHHCQCYESKNGTIVFYRPVKLTECSERKTSIYIGLCMTTEELGTSIGYCAAYSPKVNVSVVNGMYIQLPNNISELNDFMCGPMNRKGRVCSECIDGFAPSVISPWYQCANCTGAWYGIPLYLFLEFVPITLFYLAVLVFQISVISPPLTTCVMYSQLVVWNFVLNLCSSGEYTIEVDDTTVTVYIQPNIRYFSKEHAPYAVIGALVNARRMRTSVTVVCFIGAGSKFGVGGH